MKPLMAAFGGRVRLSAAAKPYLSVTVKTGEKPLDILVSALDLLDSPDA